MTFRACIINIGVTLGAMSGVCWLVRVMEKRDQHNRGR